MNEPTASKAKRAAADSAADNGLAALVATAADHFRHGRNAEAERAYRAALDLEPGQPLISHNIGVVVAAQGRPEAAISFFDAVIAEAPRYASAHYHRGVALESLGRSRAAIDAFARAAALEPEHYEAHRRIAFLLLGEGERDRALDHFARTYELRRGEDRLPLARNSLSYATRNKLRHDAQQFRHLAGERRDGQRFVTLARAYDEVAAGLPDGLVQLSTSQLATLGADYNTAINLRDAPACAAGALRPRTDVAALTKAFKEPGAGAIYFDELLSDEAHSRLRQFLLESTIWHDFSHIGGFVASYLEDGLASPLILQIADELRRTFPDVLGPHPLTQAWAFKGLRAASAVEVHADDAAVTVNFWVTPNAANRNPGTGGLTVSLVPPPAGWAVKDYDADQERIVAFLAQSPGLRLEVPYRDNRTVLFQSRLFHWSDRPDFAEGYENHRINVTLLFGRHEILGC